MVDPFNGSNRTPNEAKMKDTDYEWLTKAIALAYDGGSEERLIALGQLPTRMQETSCVLH